MKNVIFLNHKKCEGCNDTGLQIQDEGPLMGMIRICPECANDWESYKNQHGSDEAEQPINYVDMASGTIQTIKPDQKTIIINNKEIIL